MLSATESATIDIANLRGLRKGHPEDQDELEGVVEGCLVSKKRNPYWYSNTYGTSRQR